MQNMEPCLGPEGGDRGDPWGERCDMKYLKANLKRIMNLPFDEQTRESNEETMEPLLFVF